MSIHEEPAGGEAFAAQEGDDGGLLKVLLDAYAPLLRAATGEDAEQEDLATPQDDAKIADAVAARLFADETALRFLPESARQVLGPVQEWRWCLAYVRCCWMFGWLVCRGCRDYRALNYYLYRYWLCVRQAMGRPRDLTRQDREEFEKIASLLGEQYGEWLRDELVKVDLDRGGLVDDVLDSRPDCCTDNAFTAALFDRLASPEAAEALLGRQAFEEHRRHPYFWLCRCWCRAAIRFGCCLACARTRRDYLRCIREYQAALAECTGLLRCELLGPTGCVAEEPIKAILSRGVTVTGTAAGAFFGGYTIEWRMAQNAECHDPQHWTSKGVHYPGGGSIGGSTVVNGTLGWIDTQLLTARSYEVRVCLRSTRPNEQPPCCCTEYNLFKRFVEIEAVGAADVGGGGVYDPVAPLEYPVPHPTSPPVGPYLVPVGCCVNIRGRAWVGECDGRRIRCFTLRYAPGFLPGPMDSTFSPAAYTALVKPPVCYGPPDEDEKRDQANQLTAHGAVLTVQWGQHTRDESSLYGLPPGTVVKKYWKLDPSCFASTTLPACLDEKHRCASGQYTLLLDVEDELGNHYYDTQQVWFDNKPLHVELGGIEGVKGCDRASLRALVGQRPCNVPWPRPVLGMVFDEWIEESVSSYPSNNFDFYTLTITRNCSGISYQVPITPDLVRWHRDVYHGREWPFWGTARIGDPGTRCPCEPPPMGGKHHGVLTLLDLRAFDAQCVSQLQYPFAPPAGFALQRGQCCAYTFELYAQDKTVNDSGPGQCHRKRVVCAFTVCNDLPRDGVLVDPVGVDTGRQPQADDDGAALPSDETAG